MTFLDLHLLRAESQCFFRYRQWVIDAGGSIRGDGNDDAGPHTTESTCVAGAQKAVDAAEDDEESDSKEVVDLKYLQRSNSEQMDKLYVK